MPGSSYRERNSTSDRTFDILGLFTDERPRLAGHLAGHLGYLIGEVLKSAAPLAAALALAAG